MLKLTQEQKRLFAQAVQEAGELPLVSGIDSIYDRFEAARAVRKPVCNQSGECCRFEQYGHRLFVTTLEMARFRQKVDLGAASGKAGWDGNGCPHQIEGLCSVHSVRPFGCRAFFCDPTSSEWQNEQYEHFHREIRELHEVAGVPYLYVEWREALDAMGISPSPMPEAGRSLPVIRL